MFLHPLICRHWLNIEIPFGVLVFHCEMVEDVAMFGPRADLPTAQAGDGTNRVIAQDPVHDVQVVDVLFDDVISGEPREVVPVSQLPFHVAPAFLARNDPDLATVPVALGVEDIADRPVLDASNCLLVAFQMSTLGPGGDSQSLLLGQFVLRPSPS